MLYSHLPIVPQVLVFFQYLTEMLSFGILHFSVLIKNILPSYTATL